MEKLITIVEAAKLLGITKKTLDLWCKADKIRYYVTDGGHRRFKREEVEGYIQESAKGTKGVIVKKDAENTVRVFCYCRVSTKKQEESGNLERQKLRVMEYCINKGYKIEKVFSETASGINEDRKDLIKMFRSLRKDNINKIVAEYPDRLARFGLNYLLEFAKECEVIIEFIENDEEKSHNQEMAEDLIAIITSFSAKLYGARGGRKVKKTLEDLASLASEGSTENEDNN